MVRSERMVMTAPSKTHPRSSLWAGHRIGRAPWPLTRVRGSDSLIVKLSRGCKPAVKIADDLVDAANALRARSLDRPLGARLLELDFDLPRLTETGAKPEGLAVPSVAVPRQRLAVDFDRGKSARR